MLYASYLFRDGIIGLTFFLLLMFVLYLRSFKALIKAAGYDKDSFLLALCFHLIIVVFLCHEIVIEFIRHDKWQIMTWTIFGIIGIGSLIIQGNVKGENIGKNMDTETHSIKTFM